MWTANKIRIFYGTKNENDSQVLTEKLCCTFLKLIKKKQVDLRISAFIDKATNLRQVTATREPQVIVEDKIKGLHLR